jgi:hypothetical protein
MSHEDMLDDINNNFVIHMKREDNKILFYVYLFLVGIIIFKSFF